LYALRIGGETGKRVGDVKLVTYDSNNSTSRHMESKAGAILNLLRKNSGEAWYSSEIVENLREKNVTKGDVLSNIRRFEIMVGAKDLRPCEETCKAFRS